MLSSNKIIALIFTICSLNVHQQNGFTFPIDEQTNDITRVTESIDQLEIQDKLNDDIRMKKVEQQRFELGATFIPPIFDSDYKPFIDLASRLPQIIRMFHGDDPMITDDMSVTDNSDVIDFTTIEDTENTTNIIDELMVYNITDITVPINITTKTGISFTTTTTNDSSSVTATVSSIAIAGDNDLPPLPEKRYNFSDVYNKNGGGEDEEVAGKNAISTSWPITANDKWMNTKFNAHRKQPSLKIDDDIQKNYVPNNDASLFPTICVGRTTLFNELKIWDYNDGVQTAYRSYYSYSMNMALRKQIFEKGVSEKCHTPDMTDFMEYILCAILRNMRMESVHPTYPKHQQRP